MPTPLVFLSDDGYVLTLPAGWTAIAVRPGEIDLLLTLLGGSSPDVANLVRNVLGLTGARVSMVGGILTGATPGQVPPNVTVLIQPSSGLPLGLVGPVVEQLIKRVPGITGPVTRTSVAIPAGAAHRIDYQVQPTSGAGAITLRTYVIVQGDQTYLVSLASSTETSAAFQSTFDSIIQSLRFGV